jgi:hypothetical protein
VSVQVIEWSSVPSNRDFLITVILHQLINERRSAVSISSVDGRVQALLLIGRITDDPQTTYDDYLKE